jgi:acetyltransferase-like isoleucine patch superfamily enzyme
VTVGRGAHEESSGPFRLLGEKLVTAALSRIRPNTTKTPDGPVVDVVDVLHHMAAKGATAAARGALRFPVRALRGHPVLVGRSTRIIFGSKLQTGHGVFIGDFGFVSCLGVEGVRLGDRVTLRERVWIQVSSSPYRPGVLLEIGDDTYIGPAAVLGAAAPLVIGRRCQIGAQFMASAENHDYTSGASVFEQGVSREGITIGDDCWIGNGVCVLDGVRIGERAVIGAGSVVTRDVPADTLVVGVPARPVREIARPN